MNEILELDLRVRATIRDLQGRILDKMHKKEWPLSHYENTVLVLSANAYDLSDAVIQRLISKYGTDESRTVQSDNIWKIQVKSIRLLLTVYSDVLRDFQRKHGKYIRKVFEVVDAKLKEIEQVSENDSSSPALLTDVLGTGIVAKLFTQYVDFLVDGSGAFDFWLEGSDFCSVSEASSLTGLPIAHIGRLASKGTVIGIIPKGRDLYVSRREIARYAEGIKKRTLRKIKEPDIRLINESIFISRDLAQTLYKVDSNSLDTIQSASTKSLSEDQGLERSQKKYIDLQKLRELSL